MKKIKARDIVLNLSTYFGVQNKKVLASNLLIEVKITTSKLSLDGPFSPNDFVIKNALFNKVVEDDSLVTPALQNAVLNNLTAFINAIGEAEVSDEHLQILENVKLIKKYVLKAVSYDAKRAALSGELFPRFVEASARLKGGLMFAIQFYFEASHEEKRMLVWEYLSNYAFESVETFKAYIQKRADIIKRFTPYEREELRQVRLFANPSDFFTSSVFGARNEMLNKKVLPVAKAAGYSESKFFNEFTEFAWHFNRNGSFNFVDSRTTYLSQALVEAAKLVIIAI